MNPDTGEIKRVATEADAAAYSVALSEQEAAYLRRVRKTERVAALEARRASAEPIKFHYSHKRHHR
jgi:hypothetical protein